MSGKAQHVVSHLTDPSKRQALCATLISCAYVEKQAGAHELSKHTTPEVMAQRLCLDDAQLPSSRCARRRCYGVHTAASFTLSLLVMYQLWLCVSFW
jgi:hypothetical protein